MKKILLGLYRWRIHVYFAAFGALAGQVLAQRTLAVPASASAIFSLAFWVLLVLALLVTIVGARVWEPAAPFAVLPPVRGEWSALNSPASKVPSHGVRLYGQAYAIDLVSEGGGARATFRSGPAWRKPEEYPAFGAPVYAVASGTVASARDRRKDHRARSSLVSLLYMFAEGAVRELGGLSFLLGNYVVIDHGEGLYSLIAHLKRGSIKAGVGSAVEAGQLVAECGNSGNSSEPHVHVQLMDRPTPRTAHGVPIAFLGIADSCGEPIDLPSNGQHMFAEAE